MPYADPERRRAFHRAYKRRRRAEQAHPLAAFKIYICPRFPGLGVSGARFDNGFLITNRPDVQRQVERHPEFGRFIFPLALDLTCTPKEDEEIY